MPPGKPPTTARLTSRLYAILDFLETGRQQNQLNLGDRPIGVASGEVFDALIARTRAITAVVPREAPLTRSFLENDADTIAEHLHIVSRTLTNTADLCRNGANTVFTRQQPVIALISRIESEGYTVDTTNLTTVTDEWDWSPDHADSTDVHTQLQAEQTTRAAQATRYQQRLERMNTAIERIEEDYAQQIRNLIPALLLNR